MRNIKNNSCCNKVFVLLFFLIGRMKTSSLDSKNFIGHKIKVKSIFDEIIEGEIFSYDTSMELLAIRKFFSKKI